MLKAAAAHGRVEAEGWRFRRDGSRFWADVVISPIRDEAGVVQGFTKVPRDLTERKRLEELEHTTATERAREEEKKLLARELHDGLGQELTAMKMAAALVHDVVKAARYTQDADAMSSSLLTQIDEMVTSVRRLH